MNLNISKLPFKVIYCSSWENQEFHPNNLNAISHDANAAPSSWQGWQSERFCSYPQTLIVQMQNGKQRIKKLQLLSHHFMISTKVDISIGNFINKTTINQPFQSHSRNPSNSVRTPKRSTGTAMMSPSVNESFWDSIYFNRVGYVSLDDNTRTEFKARELKSIHLDVYGEFIHLAFDNCFSNSFNLFNQVGLVAINILGEPERGDVSLSMYHGNLSSLTNAVPQPDNSSGAVKKSFLVEDGGMRNTNNLLDNWVKAIIRAKEKAVFDENFTLAKALKLLLDNTKAKNEEVITLEQQKKSAIEKEDFDEAKKLKDQIENINSEYIKKLHSDGFKLDKEGNLIASEPKTHTEPEPKGNENEIPINSPVSVEKASNSEIGISTEKSKEDVKSVEKRQELPKIQEKPKASVPIEDRPLKPLKANLALSELNENSLPPGETSPPADKPRKPPVKKVPKKKDVEPEQKSPEEQPKEPAKKKNVKSETSLLGVPGAPFDPEDLPISVSSEYPEACKLYSESLVKCLLSKQFQRKEWALSTVLEKNREVYNDIAKFSGSEPSFNDMMINSNFALVQVGLSDSREKVLTMTLEASKELLAFLASNESFNDSNEMITKKIEILMPILLNRISDAKNSRMRQLLIDFAVKDIAANFPLVITSLFDTSAVSSLGKNPKLLKAKLELIDKLIQDLPIDLNLPANPVMKYVIPFYANPAAEIRELVISAAVSMYQRLLKRSVSPKEASKVIINLLESSGKAALVAAVKSKIQSSSPTSPEEKEANETLTPTAKAQPKPWQVAKSTTKQKDEPKSEPVSQETPLKVQPLKQDLPPTENRSEASADSRPVEKIVETANAEQEVIRPNTGQREASTNLVRQKSLKKSQKLAEKQPQNAEVSNNQLDLEKTCIFCEQYNKDFSEQDLDKHYWNDCKMLIKCIKCNNIVEIPNYTNHLLKECEGRQDFVECPQCHLAIVQEEVEKHLKLLKCVTANPNDIVCPMCKKLISQGNSITSEAAWKNHLLVTGCPKSVRNTKKQVQSPAAVTKQADPDLTPRPAKKAPQRKSFGFFKKLVK